jgi:hypothetical protein
MYDRLLCQNMNYAPLRIVLDALMQAVSERSTIMVDANGRYPCDALAHFWNRTNVQWNVIETFGRESSHDNLALAENPAITSSG